MHAIEAFLGRPEVERLGWALLHFAWQGAIGAAVLAATLFVLRRASANMRYVASCSVLLLMAACLPITWLIVGQRTVAEQASSSLGPFKNVQRQPTLKDQTRGFSNAIELSSPFRPSDEATRKVAPLRAVEAAPLAAAPVATWKQRLDGLLPWLAAAWLAGVTILSIRLAIGWLGVRRLRQTASSVADDGWKSALERLAERLGIRGPVALLESALVEVPTMIGWLRPAILWPPSLLGGLSIEQFESLLAHELAHIRRHDYLVNLVQTAIETLLFYHPAVWWVSSRIRQERECCCDDLAIDTCGNRISYARALAVVEELRPRPRQFALAADGGQLLTRIRRILGRPAPRATTRQWIAGATVLTFIAVALVVSAHAAFESDNEAPRQHRAGTEPIQPNKGDNSVARPLRAEQPGSEAHNSALLTRILGGNAIDAETGQPVQGFIYEEATFDDENPARFHWNGEAIAPGSQRDGAFEIVVKNRPGKPVWARIVAPGYVPQPITEKPIVLADDSMLDKFEVRMHRGKTLSGRVVDAAGKPVAAAGVYLLRNQGRRQVVRDAAVTTPNQQFEMLAITHTTTDSDGRFKMAGWDAESSRVAILSGEMNLWVTPIPADPSDWTIHLPHPARIFCEAENDRGERDTFYDLDLVTSGRKGWEMLRAYQFNLQSKDGKLELPNHTPGEYELTRRRRVAVGDFEGEFRLADVKLRVNEGDIAKYIVKRSNGWPIAGQIVGLKALGLSGAVISVEPPGEVKRGAMTWDAVTCGEDGQFETSRIPPGKYRVHVDAYLRKKAADPSIFRGGLDLPENARCPDFTADAEIIVGDVQPAPLKLELKKGGESRAFRELMQYHEKPHPAVIDPFTAPPWTVDASDQGAERSRKSDQQSATKPVKNDSGDQSTAPPKSTPQYNPIEVHGQVVDDATGKPIERFEQQGGHVDPKDATKITWGYYLRSDGSPEGRFDANIDWTGGWRARILAGGYVPQPILIEPKPGQTKIEGVVVRMKRGREISGRVLDHSGKPVKGASLFLVGSRPVDITGGKAMANGAYGRREDKSVVRYSTDADGRFTLTGVGEDAKSIAVCCPEVDLWIVPVPPADQIPNGLEIRLPEPGKLIVHYDISGEPDVAELFLQLHTWGIEGWTGVDNRRYPSVKQHGDLVLDNMTPGLYEVVRLSNGAFLDRRQVTIQSGKTVTTDFIRKSGAPVTGRIVGLDREDVQKAKPTSISIMVHKPGDEKNPIAPKFDEVGIAPFDKNGKPSDGSFKTGLIPPGDYRVSVNVFIELTPKQRRRTGLIPPGFVGEALVTVPEQGNPEPVTIELKKWGDRGTENGGAKETPKKDAAETAVKRGIEFLAGKPAEKDAADSSVKRAVEYLARKKAEQDNASNSVPDEVTIHVDPALDAELRALDAMRAGTSTNFEKVDEIGRKLLERYQKPEERGQIYFALLQVHGQSGLVTPEHIIEYAKQALKYPLGSRQELMVYIYRGDTLNVRKTERPWPEQRSEAAEVYLKGLKRVWQYNAPEEPPELPEPPPIDDSPDGAEHNAVVAAMQHYIKLKNKADFISELIYERKIFIRQIADMYHRRPATAAEIEALRKQAGEILQNDAAVARLMAAVEADPKKTADNLSTETDRLRVPEEDIEAVISKDPRLQQAVTEVGNLIRQQRELEKVYKDKNAPELVRIRSAIDSIQQTIEQIKNEDRAAIRNAQRRAGGEVYIQRGKPSGEWSKTVSGLEARLTVERGRETNGTPILASYLELRNVSDSATPIEIAIDPSKIEFQVTDAKGKDVPQAGLPYDGIVAQPGTLRLPHDSQLRLGVSGHGAGIPKDEGALLDLASSAVWLFKRGDTAEYHLQATVRISTSGNNSWHGTIDVPPVRIPLVK